jgi:hypothetical protein
MVWLHVDRLAEPNLSLLLVALRNALLSKKMQNVGMGPE